MNPIYATVAFDCGDNQKALMHIKEDLTKMKQTGGRAPEEKIGVLEPRRNSSVITTGYDRPRFGQNLSSYHDSMAIPDLAAIKAKQKAIWESGDFGQIARSIENVAEEFMARLPLRADANVLDVASGTGNLAVIAARRGCEVSGIDIAANLIAQARARAAAEGLRIDFTEGDAEAMPYQDSQFDLVVSMFGVMFTPQPDIAAAELRRVTKPGGVVALANWTPEGFLGKMFKVFKAHLPPPPVGIGSPMAWGDASTVRSRLRHGFRSVRLTRRIAMMRYPYSPADTVEFFRQYYGPTQRAFASLEASAQAALRRDLVKLQTANNTAGMHGNTEVAAEYLEVIAVRSL